MSPPQPWASTHLHMSLPYWCSPSIKGVPKDFCLFPPTPLISWNIAWTFARAHTLQFSGPKLYSPSPCPVLILWLQFNHTYAHFIPPPAPHHHHLSIIIKTVRGRKQKTKNTFWEQHVFLQCSTCTPPIPALWDCSGVRPGSNLNFRGSIIVQ